MQLGLTFANFCGKSLSIPERIGKSISDESISDGDGVLEHREPLMRSEQQARR